MNLILTFTIALIIIQFPTAASANAGVPMLFVTLPWMIIGLVPIILIETYVLKKRLACPAKALYFPVTVSNLYSTFMGIPITWVILYILQRTTEDLVTIKSQFLAIAWKSTWLDASSDATLQWMIPAAMLILLVPFFFASWLVEYHVIKSYITSASTNKLKTDVFYSNLVSYSFLASLVLLKLLYSLN